MRAIVTGLPPAGAAPRRALDIATGDGRNAIWLARHGWQTTAVDFSAQALAIAREHAEEAGVAPEFVCASILDWATDDRFDLVTVTYLHLGDEPIRALLQRIAGWLAPGGTVVMIGHDVDNVAAGGHGPADPAVLWTPALLRDAALGAGLVVERCESLLRDAAADPEKPDEEGASVDTLLVARRP
nr:class I SAM-dependent methyltransferase [Galbitalea soli]